MRVLRSRIIEPVTPARTPGTSNPVSSLSPTAGSLNPSSSDSLDIKPDDRGLGSEEVLVSGINRRRSARLASKPKIDDGDKSKDSISAERRGRKREKVMDPNAERDRSSGSDSETVKGKSAEKTNGRGIGSRAKKARGSSLVGGEIDASKEVNTGFGVSTNEGVEKQLFDLNELFSVEEEAEGCKESELGLSGNGKRDKSGETEERNLGELGPSSDLGSFRRRSEKITHALDAKRKRERDIDLNSPYLDLATGDGIDDGVLNSESGARIAQRKVEVINLDSDGTENDGSRSASERDDDKEEIKKPEHLLTGESGEAVDFTADQTSNVNGRRRYTSEEKGKANLVNDSWLSLGFIPEDNGINIEAGTLIEDAVSGLVRLQEIRAADEKTRFAKMNAMGKASRRKEYRERFLHVARENAFRFAHFHSEDEENDSPSSELEREDPRTDAARESEDWPGPFSIAMKIIKERAQKVDAPQKTSIPAVSKPSPVIEWTPSKSQDRRQSVPMVPALRDLCINVLAKNAREIASLEGVPDEMRDKLTQLLCDSRGMDNHFVELLFSASDTVIRVKDCSQITEEQFTQIFERCDTNKLKELQLDLCGRCMPDHILRTTLGRSPGSLPSLDCISLRGAYSLSDIGLNALVASAPALRSVNLGQCSLLTSEGINALADSLGSILKELYIDDCQNIDAMLILPALKKLEHLEVLSVAGIQTVCDDFVSELLAVLGPSMRELNFANCVKLTDTSLKVIGKTCPRLCSLDLVNLRKLTDSSISYLASGCRSIQMLKLCRNAFSDEAVAAFLEISGESLKELSLNNVKKVGEHTAISLARRSKNLLYLDLSWCRNLTDAALGLIVDHCLELRLLKLFGCTQVTREFLDGHSNPLVKIVGLKMTSILERLNMVDS